jgi:hypothetical protein
VIVLGHGYGLPPGEDTVWCIRADGQPLFLCGAPVGSVPAEQPAAPTEVHGRCLMVLGDCAAGRTEPDGYGTCPECGGDVAVRGGRLCPHGAWRWDAAGRGRVGAAPCLGMGLRPEEAR